MTEMTNPVSDTHDDTPDTTSSKRPHLVQVAFLSGLLVVSVWAIFESLTFTPSGRAFPLFISAALSLAVLANIVQELRNSTKHDAPDPGVAPLAGWTQGFIWIGIVALYPALIAVVGFYVATVIWLGVILRFQAQMPWRKLIASIIGFLIAWTLLIHFLGMSMPQGLFFNFL